MNIDLSNLNSKKAFLCGWCIKISNLLKFTNRWYWFCFCFNLIKHSPNTPRGDQTWTSILKHLEIYINTTCYVLTAAACITLQNSLISNIYLAKQVYNNFFKNYSLAEFTHLQIILNKTKSILANTRKTHWNNVDEQNIQIEK